MLDHPAMKTRIQKLSLFTTALAAGLLLAAIPAKAINFPGNGDGGFGGDIGHGTLTLTDDGTNIYGTMICGNGGNMYNTLVIYVDTGAGGGFSDTSSFNDQNDALRIGISGVSGSGRSLLTFTNGFAPQYAVALCPANGQNFGGIWQLASGGNNSLNYITSVGLTPVNTTSGPFTFTIPDSAIGLANGTPATIKLLGTYISTSAYRSTEAIAGNVYGLFGQGWSAFDQTAFATYSFAAPTAPSYPVTFSVDMTAQIASGAFNPANGDTVYAAGTFQTNAWSGFPLSPTLANTNIYTGVYPDYNPTNTAEQFKFNFYSVANAGTTWESVDNRPFTLQSPGVTNALVYFDDVFPTPSATTNYLTFSIDMGPQLYLGNFNPGNGDTIQVLGTLESPKWTAGGFILTNNPASSTPNIYSGTIGDGNYPGSFENYKFAIVTTSNATNYESVNNHDFFTPAGSQTFALAYFDGVSNIYATPITFQVDMTAPLATGTFNPANGDTVTAAGTFQTNQWTPGIFVLTNNPGAASSNIYSGTYIDENQPGTGEQYKFQIVSGGTPAYESIGNRDFLLGSTAQTLPVVYWNNEDPNNVLLVPTTVTFTVDMTGAVDIFGNPFNSATDDVLINGYFTTPAWYSWTDPLLGDLDYTEYLLNNNPVGSQLYTGTFTMPAGSPLEVIYKYGIVHNAGGPDNTNADNEAGVNLNHTRYIRTTGTYNFPVDIFGMQQTNLPAATESSFGELVIGQPAGGQLPVTWLGRPGVHLQYKTNLLDSAWTDLNATDGTSSNGWPQTIRSAYFRLVNP
jgi:hypothetical protein